MIMPVVVRPRPIWQLKTSAAPGGGSQQRCGAEGTEVRTGRGEVVCTPHLPAKHPLGLLRRYVHADCRGSPLDFGLANPGPFSPCPATTVFHHRLGVWSLILGSETQAEATQNGARGSRPLDRSAPACAANLRGSRSGWHRGSPGHQSSWPTQINSAGRCAAIQRATATGTIFVASARVSDPRMRDQTPSRWLKAAEVGQGGNGPGFSSPKSNGRDARLMV